MDRGRDNPPVRPETGGRRLRQRLGFVPGGNDSRRPYPACWPKMAWAAPARVGSKSSRPKPVSPSPPLASGVQRAPFLLTMQMSQPEAKLLVCLEPLGAGVYSSPGLTKLSGKSARCGGRQALPPAHDSRQKAPRRRHINQCSGFAPSARRASGSREGAGGRRGAIASGNSRGLAGGREAYRPVKLGAIVLRRPPADRFPSSVLGQAREPTAQFHHGGDAGDGAQQRRHRARRWGVVSMSCRRAALRRVPAACRCGGDGCLPVCQSHADRPFARTPPVWIRCRGQSGT